MPTLREIGKRTGYSKTTVSLALRNDRSLRAETIALIQQAAREIGYVPNPLVMANAAHMRAGGAISYRGTLAFAAKTTQREYDNPNVPLRPVFAGA